MKFLRVIIILALSQLTVPAAGDVSDDTTAAQRAAATILVTATGYSWREPEHHRYGRLNALGYCLDDTQIAADWRFYPPGTVLWIEGLGRRTVTDRGGAVRGPRHIDIHFCSLAAMRAWDTRRVRIRIIPPPPSASLRRGSMRRLPS
jgi:3D (Asp-Asp-Asp) domain-containing protein